ncbi:MAG: urease accessory protein UreD [Minwuia sp.]|uniref:urease accessory protein UreD n=1 Tax=Minwuia sp. TaxID=2493630 RepID=UPI003A852636
MNAPLTEAAGRLARLSLDFRRTPSGPTKLVRQFAQYPFHLTRPFHLDRPLGLATLFLQSSSGGLYEGDRLDMSVEVGPGAGLHLTTQASTIVHRGQGSAQSVRLDVGAGGFLAWMPDPSILFSGAGLDQTVRAVLAEGANLMLCEGLLAHDPRGHADGVRHWRNETVIDRPGMDPVIDRQRLEGESLVAALSPDGRHLAMASYFLAGPAFGDNVLTRMRNTLSGDRLYAGAGPLAGGGIVIRALAESGAALAAASDIVFRIGFEAATGVPPMPRGK